MGLDFEGVKARVSILSVAEGLTTLNRSLQGPCPKCGGEDRFYLGKSKKAPVWFVCSHCHQKAGDVIELVAWVEGISQAEACRKLGGETGAPYRPSQAEPRKPDQKPAEPPAWASAEWQAEAKAKIKQARAELTPESPAGQYLASRGLDPDTWRAFRLGACLQSWPGIEGRRPAVLIPHADQAGQVSAIKYRAFDELAKDKGQRFTQARGSQARLFGAHLLKGGGESKTLILLEGELNAAAVWQATRAEAFDVLSFGPESAATAAVPEVAELAKGQSYSRCLVWMDERARADELRDQIRAACPSLPRVGSCMSLTKEGAKMDAAEILVRGGAPGLLSVIEGLLEKTLPPEKTKSPDLAAVLPIEAQSPQNDRQQAEAPTGGRIEARDENTGHSQAATVPSLAGAIFGPPEPRESAEPLTPAELAALAPFGRTVETVRDALEAAYLPRRGSPLGAEILKGCQILKDDGLEGYACWLSGFTAEE
jgi:hypothetical protein